MQEKSTPEQATQPSAEKPDQRETWNKPELTVHSIVETTLSTSMTFTRTDSVNNYS